MNKLLEFEKLPEVNSKRWLSLENLEGEEWRPIVDEDDGDRQRRQRDCGLRFRFN